MISEKRLTFTVYKPYDYRPLTKREKRRVRRVVMKEVFEMANKFDGTSAVTIFIKARGNA